MSRIKNFIKILISLSFLIPQCGAVYTPNATEDDKAKELALLPQFESVVGLSIGGEIYVTGTKVSPFHILTSAQGMEKFKPFVNKVTGEISSTALAKEWSDFLFLHTNQSKSFLTYKIDKIIFPLRWVDSKNLGEQALNDVMLIQLESKEIYGEGSRFYDLPIASLKKIKPEDIREETCFYLKGFGGKSQQDNDLAWLSSSDETSNMRIRAIKMKHHRKIALNIFNKSFFFNFDKKYLKKMIITPFVYSKTHPVKGDNGAGLFMKDENNSYQLIGIYYAQLASCSTLIKKIDILNIFESDFLFYVPLYDHFEWIQDKVNKVNLLEWEICS